MKPCISFLVSGCIDQLVARVPVDTLLLVPINTYPFVYIVKSKLKKLLDECKNFKRIIKRRSCGWLQAKKWGFLGEGTTKHGLQGFRYVDVLLADHNMGGSELLLNYVCTFFVRVGMGGLSLAHWEEEAYTTTYFGSHLFWVVIVYNLVCFIKGYWTINMKQWEILEYGPWKI